MIGLNLHSITRPIITAIHPDEAITVYLSTGQSNVDGIITPAYAPGIETLAQVQPLDRVRMLKMGLEVMEDAVEVFINTDPVGLHELDRRAHTSGDFFRRSDGSFWRVQDTPRKYDRVGWVSAIALRQIHPPEGIEVSA